MADDVKIEGLDNVLDMLTDVVEGADFEAALKKACALVERSAKQKAPKGTGELRRSIESRIEGNKGIVFTPLEYAPYVEYGTGIFAEEQGREDVPWHYQDDEGEWHTTYGMQPSPFLRPALFENREEIKRLLGGGVKK